MLLRRIKEVLQEAGTIKRNRVQEKLNQYGDTLQVLEIDLANLSAEMKRLDEEEHLVASSGVRNAINRLFFNDRIEAERIEREERREDVERRIKEIIERTKNVEEVIKVERAKGDKIDENIVKIGEAKNFQDLNIRTITEIRKILGENEIVLTPSDKAYIPVRGKKTPYLVCGFDSVNEDIISQIYFEEKIEIGQSKKVKVSKNIEEFNINSANGIENRFILLIPIDSIPRENILGATTDNKLKVKKFDELTGILIGNEKELSRINNKRLEKVGIKGVDTVEYIDTVLRILGEVSEYKSADIREFDGYQDIVFTNDGEEMKEALEDLYRIFPLIQKASIKDIKRHIKGSTKYNSLSDILYKAIGKDNEKIDSTIKELQERFKFEISEETKRIIDFVKCKRIKQEDKIIDNRDEYELYKNGQITKADLLLSALVKDSMRPKKKRNISKNQIVTDRRFKREKSQEEIVGSKRYNERVMELYADINSQLNEHGNLEIDTDLYKRTFNAYTDTMKHWKDVHDNFNYEIELDGKKYKVRPDSKDIDDVESIGENDSIYTAAKTTFTLNKLAHSYKRQVETMIRSKFGVETDEEVSEIREKIIGVYEGTYGEETIRELRGMGDKLLVKNQVQSLVKKVGERISLERGAFECKDKLIDYMTNKIIGLKENEKANYVYGQKTDESGTMFVLDIPNYEQLRVHVTVGSQIEKIKTILPEYPLDLLTENRGNVLVRGINPELKKKIEGVGNKAQQEIYIKENIDKQQAHEIFLLLGYHGKELLDVLGQGRKVGYR